MKNIAILTCLKANDVCTGASCLDAFYNKKGFFTQYTNDDTKLVAFWTCNGCDEVLLNNQEGLLEKLERIKTRFDQINTQLSDAANMNDYEKIKNLNRERINLEEIVFKS